jgi:hypothetical protein
LRFALRVLQFLPDPQEFAGDASDGSGHYRSHLVGSGASEMMTRKEVKAFLLANEGKRVRVTYADGLIQSVDVVSVDDEGFVHSGPDGETPQGFWSDFDGITELATQL